MIGDQLRNMCSLYLRTTYVRRADKFRLFKYIFLRLDPVPCNDRTKGLKNRQLLGCAISLGEV